MIGALRHQLTLQQAVRTPDGGGGADTVWSDVAMVWANVQAVSGRERDISDRPLAKVRYKIRLRHRSGVTPGMRFSMSARLFNIQAVLDEEGRRQWLMCLCEEGETL